MRDRAFGVELEFASNGLGESGVVRELRRAFDGVGIRRWAFRNRMHFDGSELELATPVLRGKEGFEKLKLVMDTLLNIGCRTTTDDGMHVHHDAPEFINSIDNCIRLVKSWKANQHLIYQFIDPWRTEDSYDGPGNFWACPEWSNSDVRQLEQRKEIPHYSRNDLNLLSLSKHGSIELRIHEGTLNYHEAESWIKFGQGFIDRVLKHSMRDSKDATKLLKKVRVSPTAEKVLIDKAAKRRSNGPSQREYDEYGDEY